MKVKYQVFISSTYTDLKEERMAATQCLLDNNCIPVGMEQFPASDMSQMDYIQKMLDDCDYYILILGGRYGSLDQDGIGFTEKEYDYAVSKNIPVMSFLFEHPENLPAKDCEFTDEMREKYSLFRKKVCANRMVKFHGDLGTLKANIATSINQCIRDFPAIGWVRRNADEKDPEQEKIEEFLQEHTITREDIDSIFDEKVKYIPRMNVTRMPNPSGGNTVYIDEIIEAYTNTAQSGNFSFDYSNNNGEYIIGSGEYLFRTKWSKASDKSIYAYSDAPEIAAIARIKNLEKLEGEIEGPFDFSSRCRNVQLGDAVLWKNQAGHFAVTKILEIQDDTRGASEDKLVCEYIIIKKNPSDLSEDRVVFQNRKYIDEKKIEEKLKGI